MLYTVKNKKLCVAVSSRGAELNSVKLNGKEFIWQNPDGNWADHAPVLFPVCGHCPMVIDGKTMPIGVHGHVRKLEFSLVKNTEKELTLLSASDEKTKEVYPFDYEFSVTYKVSKNKLSVIYTVKNTGEKPMYFSCGGHESFNLDGSAENYFVKFDKDEDMIDYPDTDGFVTDEVIYMKKGKIIDFEENPLKDNVTIILKGVKSKGLALMKKTGEKIAEVNFGGLKNVLFWRPDDSKVVCIEPWCNFPGKLGEESKEFGEVEGVIKLDAGKTKKIVRWIKYY